MELDTFLKSIVDNLKILGSERNIRLVLDSQTNAKVDIDKELMTQALSNLIDNAVKYGEEDNFVIVKGENSPDGKVFGSVINNGEGIPKESLPKIFERFYRVESSRNRNTGGVGLGLSVVKAVVGWHGAEIAAYSETNKVTEFKITLQKSEA